MTKPMSLFCKVAALSCLPLLGNAAPDPNFHIYLLLGQSNMQGAAHLPATQITHPRVKVLQGQNCPDIAAKYGEWRAMFPPMIRCKEGTRTKPDGSSGPIGLGPGDTFATTMAEAGGANVTIGIVGTAYGGTDIEAFLPNCAQYNLCKPPYGDVSGAPVEGGTTPMYKWTIDLAKKAQQVGVIKGIIFHHGENNAGEQTWLPRVKEYITALRKDLNLDPKKVPFIAGELPRTGCCAASHNPLVQRIPEYVENGHWVSSGPKPDGTVLGDRSDKLHWSTDSVIEMGKRYAAKMLEVSDKTPPSCGNDAGVPVCCDIAADPDGDGLGMQNGTEVCVVTKDTKGWKPPVSSSSVASSSSVKSSSSVTSSKASSASVSSASSSAASKGGAFQFGFIWMLAIFVLSPLSRRFK